MKPVRTANGHFVIRRTENFVYWCAWRHWMRRELSKNFFPERICTFSEWPPETLETARITGDHFRKIRKDAGNPIPIDDQPEPWERYNYHEQMELERKHREDFMWDPPLPEPKWKHGTRSEPREDDILKMQRLGQIAHHPRPTRDDPHTSSRLLASKRPRYRENAQGWDGENAPQKPERTPEQIQRDLELTRRIHRERGSLREPPPEELNP